VSRLRAIHQHEAWLAMGVFAKVSHLQMRHYADEMILLSSARLSFALSSRLETAPTPIALSYEDWTTACQNNEDNQHIRDWYEGSQRS
jgi:hypothetical protein